MREFSKRTKGGDPEWVKNPTLNFSYFFLGFNATIIWGSVLIKDTDFFTIFSADSNLIANGRGISNWICHISGWCDPRRVRPLLVAFREKSWNESCYECCGIEKDWYFWFDLALSRGKTLISPICVGKSEWNSQTCWECSNITPWPMAKFDTHIH